MSIKQRAITNEQKEERRQEILKVAKRLFQITPYSSLSMAQIAENVGVAKGTIFLYFKTKEELFLALSLQEYNLFSTKIHTGLSRYLDLSIDCSIKDFVDILHSAITENQTLLRLIAINSVILEQNIHFNTAFNFKKMLAEQTERTSILLEKVLPFLLPGEGRMIMLQMQALAIGIQHLSEPAPVIKQVLRDEQFIMFRVNFTEFFCATVTTILKGLEARNQ